MTRRGAFATTLVVVSSMPALAHAQAALQTTLSANQAEVGEQVTVELSALSNDDSPTNPKLRVPPGFTVSGPSISSSQQISFTNGHFEHRRGITVDWLIAGTRTGHFVVGPASVDAGARTISGETASIDIVARGTNPKPRRVPNPFDPFGMFQNMPGFPNLGDLGEPAIPSAPSEAPPEYLALHAPLPMAFLRATVSPASAVVGQQVTLRIYAYASEGPYDEIGVGEPSRADFLSENIVDSSYHQPRFIVPVDGARWSVVKVREVALFPIRAGTLVVGPMTMGFRGPGYPETKPLQGLVRKSPELHVAVTEPPLAGRPPGYELGDVGKYTLSAEVEPRRVEAGDAVAVTVRVEGTGNVPHHVKHTDQNGIEWLDPTITEAISPKDSVLSGWRSFRYVVRLDEPGTHDLGDATLPYFDAEAGRYEIARARLGHVEVAPSKTRAAPSAAASASPPAAPKVFDGLGGTRRSLGALPAESPHLTDDRGFWAAVVLGPLGVVAASGLVALWRRFRRRAKERGESRVVLARRALADARAAALRNDGFAIALAVERALYATIEERHGLKARAVLRQELGRTLERNGTNEALAAEIVSILDGCDALRFTGEGGTSGAALVDRAASAVDRMTRGTKGKQS